MTREEATNPANETRIVKALEIMFDMDPGEIGFDICADEDYDEIIAFGFTPMFDQVVLPMENIDI